jgi:hypothetical protein
LGLFGPKGAEIGTYRTTFVYQGPFNKDASTGSRVINEVVLRSGVTYKAVVTTGAKDVAGNPLDQNPTAAGLQQKVWLFTVSN